MSRLDPWAARMWRFWCDVRTVDGMSGAPKVDAGLAQLAFEYGSEWLRSYDEPHDVLEACAMCRAEEMRGGKDTDALSALAGVEVLEREILAEGEHGEDAGE